MSLSNEATFRSVLYPLRFTPLLQYRVWGGRRLINWVDVPFPEEAADGSGLIGEAWLLSDRASHASVVQEGSLKGWTISKLMSECPTELLGEFAGKFDRFPILLKFLDVQEPLSVQVHPRDGQVPSVAKNSEGDQETGKTEGWLFLETGPRCLAYAGIAPHSQAEILRDAIGDGTLIDHLHPLHPREGDAIFIPAGMVHCLEDAVVFEVQENSDVTYRLFDWDHVDPRTGKPRPLQIKEALESIDYTLGPGKLMEVKIESSDPILREGVFECSHFRLERISGCAPFPVGKVNEPCVLVCVKGHGQLDEGGFDIPLNVGDVVLLPASVGQCICHPDPEITLLEVSLVVTAP